MRAGKVIGVFLVATGIFFFLKATLNFSLAPIAGYWPLALVVAGIFFVLRQRLLGALFLVFTLFLLLPTCSVSQRHYTQELPYNGLSKEVFKVDFGAGKLLIDSDSRGSLIRTEIDTASTSPPSITVAGNELSIARGGYSNNDVWRLSLSPLVTYDMQINFGAADSSFDFSGLTVSNLIINTGASKSVIKLAAFPTKVKIESGATDLTILVPEGFGAKVIAKAPLSSLEFEDFSNNNGAYTNAAYDTTKDHIEITLNTAASSVKIKS